MDAAPCIMEESMAAARVILEQMLLQGVCMMSLPWWRDAQLLRASNWRVA